MIRSLHLDNFLFIERADLEFGPGLNVITGETGAGKSVLLESLKLLLGKRARSGLQRAGNRPARLQAVIDLPADSPAREWLQQAGLANEDDPGQLTLSRSFRAEGGGQCWINGILTQASSLAQLGVDLVEIHGQNEHQSLLDPATQRRLLDRFGDEAHQERVAALRRAHGDLIEARRALSELEQRLQTTERRLAELTALDRELDELALSGPDEVARLLEEEKTLAHADEIGGELARALGAIEGDEETAGAHRLLVSARDALRRIRMHGSDWTALAERLDGMVLDLGGLERDLAHSTRTVTVDPRRLDAVQQRLATIERLGRRHGVEPRGLPDLHRQVRAEIGELTAPDSTLRHRRDAVVAREREYDRLADAVGEERQRLAGALGEAITHQLDRLGFHRARLRIDLNPAPPGPSGREAVAFGVELNAGAGIAPLARVASGGELSRVALAIRTVLAAADPSQTLVFDEIDAGIGGTTAMQVASQLGSLGRQRQVILVTHLHQIAREGTRHFAVTKEATGDQTRIGIRELTAEEREPEIARMLGILDESGRRFARSLLRHGAPGDTGSGSETATVIGTGMTEAGGASTNGGARARRGHPVVAVRHRSADRPEEGSHRTAAVPRRTETGDRAAVQRAGRGSPQPKSGSTRVCRARPPGKPA